MKHLFLSEARKQGSRAKRKASLFFIVVLFFLTFLAFTAYAQPMTHDGATVKKEIKELQEKYKRDRITKEEYEKISSLLRKRLAVTQEYSKRKAEEEKTNYAQKEFERAQRLSDYGNYKEAKRIYDWLLERSHPQKQLEYGKSLYEKGDYDQALIVYQKLLANYPESGWVDDAHFGRGMIYYTLGKFQEAMEEFIRVSEDKFKSELSSLAKDMIKKSLLASYEIPNCIRVAISLAVPKVELSAIQGFKVIDLTNGEPVTHTSSNKVLSFKPTQQGIKIKGRRIHRLVTVPLKVIALQNRPLRVGGKEYRGQIVIRKGRKGLTIINEINLDDYLYGVLPHEISPAWPKESLRAQAIASRTLALYLKERNQRRDYDLDATVFSQVYEGRRGEDQRTNRAIDETKGEILTYKGEVINSVYHAICGGQTEDAKNVWRESKEPYLESISCGFCHDAPYYQWEIKMEEKTLRNIFQKQGFRLSRIREIELGEVSKAGRVIKLLIKHRKATLTLTGNNFRLFVGPNLLKSALFTIEKEKDGFLFKGRGWGHGVGMCQWGARGMAEKGKTYQEILKHYYSGAEIKKVY